MRSPYRFLLIAALCLPLFIHSSACDTPTEFQRTNRLDPGSTQFVPVPPGQLAAVATGEEVVLSWNDESNFEAGYLVERAADDTVTFTTIGRLEPNTTEFREPYVKPAIHLYYRVSSFSEKGDEMRRKVGRTVQVALYPEAGEAPRVKLVNEKRMDVQWNDPLDFETGFELQRAVDAEDFQTIAILGPDVTRASDEILLPPGWYRYRVRPLYEGASPPFSDVAHFNLTRSEYSAPSYVMVSVPDSATVQVRWYAKSRAAGYILERATGEGGTFDILAELPPSERTYLDATLDHEVGFYRYRVRTLLSAPSHPVSVRYDGTAWIALN